jgi:hypothetical protein
LLFADLLLQEQLKLGQKLRLFPHLACQHVDSFHLFADSTVDAGQIGLQNSINLLTAHRR